MLKTRKKMDKLDKIKIKSVCASNDTTESGGGGKPQRGNDIGNSYSLQRIHIQNIERTLTSQARKISTRLEQAHHEKRAFKRQ